MMKFESSGLRSGKSSVPILALSGDILFPHGRLLLAHHALYQVEGLMLNKRSFREYKNTHETYMNVL